MNRRGMVRRPSRRFSVIAAAYNVEQYLDAFFESIRSQTLDFRSNIELIVVDDGSTDRSAKIIKRWQAKYPKNIRHIRQSNQGPSSARNRGLAEASSDWLTFIDPDDFVSPEYFQIVDDTINRHQEQSIAAVSCKVAHYIDATNTISDRHPLRFRFAKGERSVQVRDLADDFQVTVCGAFWRRDVITEQRLSFDRRLKTGGDDVLFSGQYFLGTRDECVIFQPAATYFHRRRADQSSLTQTGWQRPQAYDDELRFAYLGLAREAQSTHGQVPIYIQNTLLYCLSWLLRRAVDQPTSIAFLSDERQQRCLSLLEEIFSSIDKRTIEAFPVNLPRLHQAGILARFKNLEASPQTVEITDLDSPRGLLRLVYWSRQTNPVDVFRWGEQSVTPAFKKVRRVDFMSETFIHEHIRWIPFPADAAALHVFIDKRAVRIAINNRLYDRPVSVAELRRAIAPAVPPEVLLPSVVNDIRRAAIAPEVVDVFDKAWLFIDRDTEADDNAEHLYRYVRAHAPEINAFFILQRGCPHWARLAAEGFRLIGFNEPQHALALLNATLLISSQADHYVTDYLGRVEFGDRLRYRFVFLQHGVTQADFADWFNKRHIDCLITSTIPEHRSIVADGSRYTLTEKETVLTGLPRHDALLAGQIRDGRQILIMPTWRNSLTGLALGPGHVRASSPKFYESEFAKRWKSLLHSPHLMEAALNAECRIVFVPHPMLEQYVDDFDVPSPVEVRTFADGDPIQTTFRDASLFVTDYSSKAFDIALLGKPVIYYQFDLEEFFRGGHMGLNGYFDFERDGFGPVCRDEDAVLDAIERLLDGTPPDPVYRQRAGSVLPFRDGRCCERVFRAILDLDRRHNDTSGHA